MKIILIVVLLAIAGRKVESAKCYCVTGTGTGITHPGVACSTTAPTCDTDATDGLCIAQYMKTGDTPPVDVLVYGCKANVATGLVATAPAGITPATFATVATDDHLECDPATAGDYCNFWSYRVVSGTAGYKMYATHKCLDAAKSLPAWSTPTQSTMNCLYCKLEISVDSVYTYSCVKPDPAAAGALTSFELPATITLSATATAASAIADKYKDVSTLPNSYECAGVVDCLPDAEPPVCVAGTPCFVTATSGTTPVVKKFQTVTCSTTNTTTVNTVSAITRVYSDLSYCCDTCTVAAPSILGKLCHCQFSADAGIQNCNDISGHETDVYESCAAVNLGVFVARVGLKTCTATPSTANLGFLGYTCCTDSNCLSGTVSLTGDEAPSGVFGSLGGGCSSANSFYPTRMYLLISAAVLFFLLN